MTRKKRNKLIIATISLVIITLLSVAVARYCFSWNRYAVDRYGSFWEDPGEYDVWFMGSSHTYYSVYPMELYRHYGITSFDIASPSSTLPQTYWTMMNALKRGTPDIIIVDVYHIDMEEPLVDMEEKIRTGFDAIPFSKTKLDMINDLVADNGLRKDLMIPLYLEKGEYSKIIKKDKTQKWSLSRGALLSSDIKNVTGEVLNENLPSETMGTKYLLRIIEECKERDIDLVITAFPFVGRPEKQQGLHTGIKIAKEQGVPYIDMSYCPELVDYSYEFAKDGHLNVSGALKMTRYVGDYIQANYNLKDHRSSKDSNNWSKDLNAYQEYIEERMKSENNPAKYLLWTKTDYMKTYIYIKDNSLLNEETNTIIKSLENNDTVSKDKYKELTGKPAEADICIYVEDAESGEPIDTAQFEVD